MLTEYASSSAPAEKTELTPISIGGSKEQYYAYKCVKCGEEARNTYSEPYRSRMLENRHCWNCDFWADMERRLQRKHATMTIIAGHIYTPGNGTYGPFRGMGGRRFDIEYIEPSIHAGKRTTTFDLWSGATLPAELRERFPDTAVFLNGAERCQVGDTGCWNPSEGKAEPHPLPRELGIGR